MFLVVCGLPIEKGTFLYVEIIGLGVGIWDIDGWGCDFSLHVAILPNGQAFNLGPADKTKHLLHTNRGNGDHVSLESLIIIKIHPSQKCLPQ